MKAQEKVLKCELEHCVILTEAVGSLVGADVGAAEVGNEVGRRLRYNIRHEERC